MRTRSGITPVERPTEWTTAVVMIVLAILAYQSDHNTAALVAVAAAALPVIVTAIVSAWDKRTAEPPSDGGFVRLGVIVALAVVMVGVLMAAPASADQKNCDPFYHHNQAQHLQVCVALNHSHNGYVNNVHMDFDDHLGNDVYYIRDVDISLYWLSNQGPVLVDTGFYGDFPVFATETDLWLDHGCMQVSRDVIGIVSFRIQWDGPNDNLTDIKTVSSDIGSSVICL